MVERRRVTALLRRERLAVPERWRHQLQAGLTWTQMETPRQAVQEHQTATLTKQLQRGMQTMQVARTGNRRQLLHRYQTVTLTTVG